MSMNRIRVGCLEHWWRIALPAADDYPNGRSRAAGGAAAGAISWKLFGQNFRSGSVVVSTIGGGGAAQLPPSSRQAVPDVYPLYSTSALRGFGGLYKNPGYDPFKEFAPIISGVIPNDIRASVDRAKDCRN